MGFLWKKGRGRVFVGNVFVGNVFVGFSFETSEKMGVPPQEKGLFRGCGTFGYSFVSNLGPPLPPPPYLCGHVKGHGRHGEAFVVCPPHDQFGTWGADQRSDEHGIMGSRPTKKG